MSGSSCDITLFAPGLLGPQAGYFQLAESAKPDLPFLTTLLSRARIKSKAQHDWLREVFHLFAIATPAGATPPIAPVTALADGADANQGWWLRADPVYLQVDRDRALLLAAEEIGLQLEEACSLAGDINRHFAGDAFEIIVLHPQRWYLRFTARQEISTTPLYDVIGQNIFPFLPVGEARPYWHTLLNELQMLLHRHPLNRQREKEGRLPVNSLWFWGEGFCPATPKQNWDGVFTDDVTVQAVARFCQLPCAAVSDFHPEKLQGSFLLVLNEALASVRHGDVLAWLDRLKKWDETLFAMCIKGLKNRSIQHLALLDGEKRVYRLAPSHLRRWWRRRQPLETFCTHA